MVDAPGHVMGEAPDSHQASASRQASVFLGWGAAIIALAHGVEVLHAGRPNWPALAVRLAWSALLLVVAALLRRAPRRVLLAGAAAAIFGSALLDLALLLLTGRSASPLLAFTYVLATVMPFMAFELFWVGLLGSALLLCGTGAMLVLDGAPIGALISFANAGFGALACGWLLASAFDRARREDEARRLALAEAMASVKTLRGLLPVCAWCRRVRSDSGYWEQLEAYVTAHTDAEITHGLCQDCEQQHFGGVAGQPAPGAPPRAT